MLGNDPCMLEDVQLHCLNISSYPTSSNIVGHGPEVGPRMLDDAGIVWTFETKVFPFNTFYFIFLICMYTHTCT